MVGLSSMLTRQRLLENLERMAGGFGLLQAVYFRLTTERGITRYVGDGFVHAVTPQVAETLLAHEGIEDGGRRMSCEPSWWEIDLAAHKEVYSDFGGPRFSLDGSRHVLHAPVGDWEKKPEDWDINTRFKGSKEWISLFEGRLGGGVFGGEGGGGTGSAEGGLEITDGGYLGGRALDSVE